MRTDWPNGAHGAPYDFMDESGRINKGLPSRRFLSARPTIRLGQPIHLIGVEFSKESRAVVGFEVETLG